jgi:hypothetical protein
MGAAVRCNAGIGPARLRSVGREEQVVGDRQRRQRGDAGQPAGQNSSPSAPYPNRVFRGRGAYPSEAFRDAPSPAGRRNRPSPNLNTDQVDDYLIDSLLSQCGRVNPLVS